MPYNVKVTWYAYCHHLSLSDVQLTSMVDTVQYAVHYELYIYDVSLSLLMGEIFLQLIS